MQFQIQEGKIADVEIFSDAMQIECLEDMKKYLKGIPYSKRSICSELSLYWSMDAEEEKIIKGDAGGTKNTHRRSTPPMKK